MTTLSPLPVLLRTISLIVGFLLLSFALCAQAGESSVTPNLPPAPSAAGLGRVTEVPVGEYTGSFNYSVPVKTISYKNVAVPVSLSYQSGGIRVADEASEVGLGWNLNAGGLITRAIRGGDDFGGNGVTGYLSMVGGNRVPNAPLTSGWQQLNTTPSLMYCVKDPFGNEVFSGGQTVLDTDICPAGQNDMESDLYTFSFLGMSGKFIIDRQGKCKVLDNQDLDISFSPVSGGEYQWTITDAKGITYRFGTTKNARQFTWKKTVSYSSTNFGNWNYNTPQWYEDEYTKYASAWFIESVELPNPASSGNGREVAATFVYDEKGEGAKRVRGIPTFSEFDEENIACLYEEYDSLEGCNRSPSQVPVKTSVRTINLIEYDRVQLSSIEMPFEQLDFDFSKRDDLVNGWRVDKIRYSTKKGSTLYAQSSTQLDYSYSIAPLTSPLFFSQWEQHLPYSGIVNDNVSPEANRQRLILNSVTEIGKTGEALPPYSFAYNKTLLPAKTSFATDSWGYFNGVTENETYLPPHMEYGVEIREGQIGDIIIEGADKTIDADAAQAQHLIQVVSPLGGTSNFTLEGNDYYFDGYEMLPRRATKNFGVQMSGECYTNISSINNQTFTINNLRTDGAAAMVRMKLDWTRFLDCAPQRAGENCVINNCLVNNGFNLELRNASGQVVGNWNSDFAGVSGGEEDGFVNHTGVDYFDLPNGEYRFFITSELFGRPYELGSDFAFLGVNFSWSQYEYVGNKESGGLRVAETTYSPGDGPDMHYVYDYKDDDGNSTGIPVNLPLEKFTDVKINYQYNDCDPRKNYTYFVLSAVTCQVLKRSSTSFSPLSTSLFGKFTGYSSVTKKYGAEADNGRTVSTFFNRRPDIIRELDFENQALKAGISGPRTQRNGRMEKQEVFSKEGVLLQETTNEYSSAYHIGAPIWYYRIASRDNRSLIIYYSDNGAITTSYGSSSSLCGSFLPFIVAYQDVAEWNQLLSTTTRTYDQGGAEFTEVVRSQTYDQDDFTLRTQSISGPGGGKETQYFYPKDLPATHGFLTTKGMTALPVKTIGPDQTETLVDYDDEHLVPKKITQTFTDGSSIVSGEVMDFNDEHLPTEVKVHGASASNFYVWNDRQLIESTRFLKHRQSFTYLNSRQLHKTKGVDGQEVTYTYDNFNRLETTSARGGDIKTTNKYQIGGPNETTITTTFDDAPTMTEKNTFDGMGRPISTKTNGVEQSKTAYDAFGRAYEQLYMPGYGNVTSEFEASPLNRTIRTVYPDGQSVGLRYLVHNQAGGDNYPKVETTDEMGNVTSVSTDVFGRTFQQVDANGGTTTYQYTDFDAPLTITPPAGAPYKYSYYSRGNLLESKTIPDGGTTFYHYGNSHRLKAVQLPIGDKTISTAYDAYGRAVATSRGNAPVSWGPDYTSFSAPLTTTDFYEDEPYAITNNLVVSTAAAFLLPNGDQGSMVTTTYQAPDEFGRVTDYNESYALDGNSYTDIYTSEVDHRGQVLTSTTGHAGANLSQAYTYDDFSRPTSAQSSLNYFLVLPSATPFPTNIGMKYNTAGQLTSRSLLTTSTGAVYGENMKYNHPRGWLTSINKTAGRSFDTYTCEAPTEDVYETIPEEQETDITTIFANLAAGEPVFVEDLECVYDTPNEPCLKPVGVGDYLVSVPNPIKIGKEEFAEVAGVPCPVGSNCSSSLRAENLKTVKDISITGLKVLKDGQTTTLTLPYAYSLNMLLSNQIEGVNKPELIRFQQDLSCGLKEQKAFIRDLQFSLKSDAVNCVKDCNAGGTKNYRLDILFRESSVVITGLEATYVYTSKSAPSQNRTFRWDRGVAGFNPRTINLPCEIELCEKSFARPAAHNDTNNKEFKLLPSLPSQAPWRSGLGADAGARKVIKSKENRITFHSGAVSPADSATIITTMAEACPTSADPMPRKPVEDAKVSTSTPFPISSNTLTIKSFFGREHPHRGITITPTGTPFRFRQGTNLPSIVSAANAVELQRLEQSLNEWLQQNNYNKQKLSASLDEENVLRLELSSGLLNIIHATVSTEYQIDVRCPDASTDSIRTLGTDRLTYAQVRSQTATASGVYLPTTKPDNSFKPSSTPSSNTALKNEKDDPSSSTCPDLPAPDCTIQEQQQQLSQVQGFYAQTTATNLQNLPLPTTLYRVELCDGSFALLLQHQLDQLTGDYNVLGSLPITDIDQPITATLRGVNQLFALSLDYNPNGNIKTATWKTTYHAPNTYEYEYDPLNRLKSATYNPSSAPEGSGPAGLFSVSGITYDAIGNIQTLNRMGLGKCKDDGSVTFGSIDKLVYGYAGGGSQLTSVTDNATGAEFKNQGVKPHSGSYTYDAAGRMTYDPHRDLTIAYNHLDLPRRINGPGGLIEITYDATGRKWLQKKEKDATMYVGAFTFKKENGNGYLLEAANTGEGRIVYDKDNQQLFNEYFHKDHLGNIRLAFTDRNEDGKVELLGSASEITQQNDFYPFGMAHKGEGLFHGDLGSNRYRYNGKELNEELGLYDYGARNYDPAIGRWLQVDPAANLMPGWSPYNYTFNNPLSFIDPDGTIPWPIQVRSFISASRVSGYFRGDGRRPNARENSPRNTSRVRSSFTADPSAGTVSNISATSDPTVFYAGDLIFSKRLRDRAPGLSPVVARSGDPDVSISNVNSSDGGVSFNFSHEGRDPLTPPGVTPDLDVNGSFSLTENLEEGTLNIAAELSGDVFPSTEVLIGDQSGTNLLLGTHMEQGGIAQLFGENENGLISINLTINFDSDGNFTSVSSNGNSYTVEEWNRLVQRNSR